jgi:hypothetical protein
MEGSDGTGAGEVDLSTAVRLTCEVVTSRMRTAHQIIFAALVPLCTACHPESTDGPPSDGLIAIGTWGGDSAGVIVNDSIAHVHIGCTYGDLTGRVTLDANGRFTRTGSFLLRAYPVAIGPTMPASFSGRVSGKTLTLTVTVNDTISNTIVVRGPVSVRLGSEPRLGPCPICRVPGDRSSARSPLGSEERLWYQRIIGLFVPRARGGDATPPTRSPPAGPPAGNTPRR